MDLQSCLKPFLPSRPSRPSTVTSQVARGRHPDNLQGSGTVVKSHRMCQECLELLVLKAARQQTIETTQELKRMGMDLIGLLPKSKQGNIHILVMQDYFTKWPEAILSLPAPLYLSGTGRGRLAGRHPNVLPATHKLVNHCLECPVWVLNLSVSLERVGQVLGKDKLYWTTN